MCSCATTTASIASMRVAFKFPQRQHASATEVLHKQAGYTLRKWTNYMIVKSRERGCRYDDRRRMGMEHCEGVPLTSSSGCRLGGCCRSVGWSVPKFWFHTIVAETPTYMDTEFSLFHYEIIDPPNIFPTSAHLST